MFTMKAVSIASLLALAGSVQGQCIALIRSQVPDFDQRRATDFSIPVVGLPNNGSMYCVPTSWTNYMAWLSNRGYVNAMGTSGNWAASSRYATATSRIAQMGDLMDTSADGGTSSGDAIEGLVDYLDDRNVGLPAIAYSYVANDDWAPKPENLRAWFQAGAMVCVCFGKYVRDGSEWERSGGHCMTLVSVRPPCNGRGWVIGLRDPWTGSSDSRFTQSNFSTRSMELFANTFNFDGDVRKQYRDINDTDNTRYYLDKIQVLFPLIAVVGSGTQVQIHHLTNFWNELPQVQSFPGPTGLTIDSVLSSPALDHAAVITRPVVGAAVVPSKLWRLDLGTGLYQHVADLPSLPSDSAYDRQGNLYTINGVALSKFNIRGEEPTLDRTVSTGVALDAIVVNPNNDSIIGLDVGRRAVISFAEGNLDNPPTDRNLGGTFPLGGAASIAVNPINNSLWITSSESTVVRRLAINIATGDYISVESVNVPAGMNPRSLSFTGRGEMVIGDGSVRILRQDGAGGWVEAPDHPLAGLPVNGRFSVPRSGHNHGPAQLMPAWADLPDPEDVPGTVTLDCGADFDANGELEVPDIFAFLSAWFAGDLRADMNGSGGNDVPDIFDYLSMWFAGCGQ